MRQKAVGRCFCAVASAYRDLEKVERVRSMYRDAQFKDSWRDLEVTYIFGKTGGGKTRSVMDKYGYANCYRVTDYKHPFDTYDGQDVIIFEEFRSGLKHVVEVGFAIYNVFSIP